jgi:hypothetical protein
VIDPVRLCRPILSLKHARAVQSAAAALVRRLETRSPLSAEILLPPGAVDHEAGARLDDALRSAGYVQASDRRYESALYVAVSKGAAKVGISRRPLTRVKSLGPSSGRKVQLVALFPALALHLERAILERFSAQRADGEWLRRDDEVNRFVEACALVSPPPEAS